MNVAHTTVSLNVTSCDLRPISIANLQVVRGYRKCSCVHRNEWNACLTALKKKYFVMFFTFLELVNPWEDEKNHYCWMNISRLLLRKNIAYSDPEFKNELFSTLCISISLNSDLKRSKWITLLCFTLYNFNHHHFNLAPIYVLNTQIIRNLPDIFVNHNWKENFVLNRKCG